MEPIPAAAAPESSTFPLRGHTGPVVLDAQGIHHPLTARGGRVFTPYEDVVHVALSQRAFWIGSRRNVAVLPRNAFVEPGAPEALARALLERIAARPGSRAQLARMAEIDERARSCPPPRVTYGLALLCLVGYALQLWIGQDVFDVGHMSAPLVADGDAWRLVTANLLHDTQLGFHLHLILNLLALLAFGSLCERSLGAARTLAVMGVSGLGSMTAHSFLPLPVVGVSGVVFGLIGAVTWLEHFRTEDLPAWWRVPRRPLYVFLAVSALLGYAIPFIAGAAHAGGFVAGVLCAALLADRPLRAGPAPAPVRALASLVVLATAASVGVAVAQLAEGDYGARYLARLGRLPNITTDDLNNRAWLVAIDDASTTGELEAALALAERAVRETDRRIPTVLDTLAELQFLTGATDAAVATIEEAMALAPREPYYAEQRRRFLGERSDRPEPPSPFRIVPPKPAADGSEITA